MLDEIRLMLRHKKIDILALNETRLDSSISDELVGVDGYDLLRADRTRNGGGVCIYIRCNINYQKRPDLVPNDLEAVSIEVRQANSQSFIISSVYRPPNSKTEVFLKIERLIQLIDNENKEVYILGELNINLLEPNLSTGKKLQEIMELYQLTQIINDPTRITEYTKSLIDVCITSSPEKIISTGVIHLGISDHSLIYAIRKLNYVPKTGSRNQIEYRNFKQFKAESFLNDLYILPWSELDNKQNVDEMWECWKSLFIQVLDKHAPLKTKRVRKKGSVPWINKDIKSKLFERDFIKRKAIKTNEASDWNRYKSSRNRCNIAFRHAKREYYATKFLNHKNNTKHAWKTINDILGRSHNQNTIHEIKLSGKSITWTEELKEVFNEYFTNIGHKLAQTIEHDSESNFGDFITKQEPARKFSFEAVNEFPVYRLITKLPTSKATGVDKISTKVLQVAAPAVPQPLTKIFNKSIVLGQFPSEWKAARVIPVFKNGQRTMLDNYRPISILPVVSKLIERILYNQISEYLEKESILFEYQFGFRSCHSTTTTLIDCTNEWYVNMDRGHYNSVVFLDIKKAFDTVNHDILLKKLEMYCLAESALALLRNYLTDRTKKCNLQGMLSKQRKISCGIPQGSILGLLLFTTYINDLPNCLKHTTPRMFADDTSLTAAGETLNEVEKRANEDLKNVRNWLSGSRYRLNSLDVQPSINIDKQSVKRVKHTTVLAVQIDEHLNWEEHIESIASKISSGIGAI